MFPSSYKIELYTKIVCLVVLIKIIKHGVWVKHAQWIFLIGQTYALYDTRPKVQCWN